VPKVKANKTQRHNNLTLWRPLLPYGNSYKASCARPGLAVIVIFDIRPWAPEFPNVKNYKWRLNPVWHRVLYGRTHMATMGVKNLTTSPSCPVLYASRYAADYDVPIITGECL